MNVDQSTLNAEQFCQIKYSAVAAGSLIDKKPWKSHPCNSILGRKIHVSPSVRVSRNDTIITISLGGAYFASFDKNAMLATPKSVGPFIDCIGVSIKRKKAKNNKSEINQESHCVEDSQGGTEVKSVQSMKTFTSSGLNLNLTGSMNQEPYSKSFGVAPFVGFSTGLWQTQEILTESEFSPEKFAHDNGEIGVRAVMDKCWTDAKLSKDYKPGQISTLRQSKHDERVRMALVPIWGWFGGFLTVPDVLCTPPRCAQKSLGMNWNISYYIPSSNESGLQDSIRFKLKLEARTVFATNESIGGYRPSGTGNFVSHLATIHQIGIMITVNMFENSIAIEPASMKVLCEGGVEDKVKDRSLTQTLRKSKENSIDVKDESLNKYLENFLLSSKQLSQPEINDSENKNDSEKETGSPDTKNGGV